MSLYNMVCENNPFYSLYLAMLSEVKKMPDIPRFRDLYIKSETEPTIVVYTRTGGGNREGYESENSAMCLHPLFLRDWDDDFDSTFAHWEYKVPEKYKDRVSKLQGLLEGLSKFSTPGEKFKRSLDSIQGSIPAPESMTEDKADEIKELVTELAKELGLISGQPQSEAK